MKWLSLVWIPAALVLFGAGPQDGDNVPKAPNASKAPDVPDASEELGGTYQEAKEKIQDIAEQKIVMQRILQDAQAAVTQGRKAEDVIQDLEKRYAQEAKSGADLATRRASEYALRILDDDKKREVLERVARSPAALKKPDLQKWIDFAQRAQRGGPDDSDAAVAGMRSGAWDGAPGGDALKTSGTGTPFFSGSFSGPASTSRVSQQVEQGVARNQPGVERSKSIAVQVEEIRAAVGQNVERRKQLQMQIAKMSEERAGLVEKVRAEGPLPASAAGITLEMQQIKQANAGLLQKDKDLAAQQKPLEESLDQRNAQIRANNEAIKAPNFYENHKADCRIAREWMEGNQRRFEFFYIPTDRLIEARDRDRSAWNQLKTQRDALGQEANGQVERWNKLKKTRDAVAMREKIEHLELRHRESVSEIEKLKGEARALKGRLAELLEELRSIYRRLKDWAQQAEEAVKSVREGR